MQYSTCKPVCRPTDEAVSDGCLVPPKAVSLSTDFLDQGIRYEAWDALECDEGGTLNGFSGFMRDAIRAAGLPLDCKPHGLRKTLGRLLADAGASAHDIMAALGHTTLT